MTKQFGSVTQAAPLSVSRATQAQQVTLRLKPMADWRLIYHPMRYFWAGKEYGWLPDLGRQHMTPGCNGVGLSRGGMDGTRAELNLRAQGSTVISWADVPEDLRDVVVAHRTPGGLRYEYRWVTWTQVGRIPRKKVDADERLKWLRALVDRGVVPPISDDVRDALVAELKDQLARSQERLALRQSPALAARAEALMRQIDEIEGAVAPRKSKKG